MKAAFPSRPARAHYRHELRTLTYVTLDQANGGIVRNLNHHGVAVQAVGPLRQQQRVRLRFELRFPRVRVETHGEVSWTTSSGQCGIRFVDLPARTQHQIDEWIFSNLLDGIVRTSANPATVLEPPVLSMIRGMEARREKAGQNDAHPDDSSEGNAAEGNDGLILSTALRPAIRLQPAIARRDNARVLHPPREKDQQNWLSQPLSPRAMARLVDTLVVIAALLLFALIFLAIAHELPPWPLTLSAASAAALFVAAAYRALFGAFGGSSLGTRLAAAAKRSDRRELTVKN